MHFYMSAVGIVLTAAAALVAGWLGWRLSQGWAARSTHRLGVVVLAMCTTVALMAWDVVKTSLAMAKLCPQAGVFVKKSVRVDGYFTNSGGADGLKAGFKFIEKRNSGNTITIYQYVQNKINEQVHDANSYKIKSQYEFIYESASGPYDGRNDIGFLRSAVRDRAADEELGFTIQFTAYPGWLERNTINLLTRIRWNCPEIGHLGESLREKTLLPVQGG